LPERRGGGEKKKKEASIKNKWVRRSTGRENLRALLYLRKGGKGKKKGRKETAPSSRGGEKGAMKECFFHEQGGKKAQELVFLRERQRKKREKTS